MPLSWNEIKDRAINFSKEWQESSREEADAKSFLDAFFNVFGINRRRVSTFEFKTKKIDNKEGYIDLLWKGVILIEMKSKGKDLEKAYNQAKDYFPGIEDKDLPKFILVSDFENFRLYDLEEDKITTFKLNEFVNNVQNFGYLIGYQKKIYKEQDPVNIEAAKLMSKLHDSLKEIGYNGHPLEVYLVRVLFCLFAEDTTIFNKFQFQDFIETRTNEDGSDLASKLHELFQILNTKPENRLKNLDKDLADFPYVNGKLFEENLSIASFDKKMRQNLLNCCYLDWSKISPAIFGSMFQNVMNPDERRNLGAHYTSEKNILKLIKPLFLDELYTEFESVKNNKNKLFAFHLKLSTLKFLDPACGCGNFLVVTYRELRLLELEILRATFKFGEQVFDINDIIWLNVDMMYGIEYEEFPSRVAEVAMWLIDHQMNMLISAEFGKYFVRLPLNKSAKIVNGDALNIDWQTLLNPINPHKIYTEHADIYELREPEAEYYATEVYTKTYKIHKEVEAEKVQTNALKKFDYILGNPPFVGSRMMNKTQKESLRKVFDYENNSGELDYVTAWYIKAAQYIRKTKIKVAFVSTNSIVQGIQTSILWKKMLNKYKITIHFAHRTFKWGNEAKGNAAVYCVIIGFGNFDCENKWIFDYEDIKGEPQQIKAKNINPYLVDGKNILIEKRSKPICNVPEMNFGNMPADGGEFLFTDDEKEDFIKKEPNSSNYFRELISAKEFLNNKKRWCLWLLDIEPNVLRQMPLVLERVENVKKLREKSSRPHLAQTPYLFAQITQPKDKDFIIIPRVSSENRIYIPIGMINKNCIASDTCLIIPDGNLFHFGVLTSLMHMAWVKYVCGRLKSDFRYSKDLVYNNFPFPQNPTEKQIKDIKILAQKILDIRLKYKNSSLADLYDPLTIPSELLNTHKELDKAVDLTYRATPFTNDAKRLEFLFELYRKYINAI